MNNVLIEMKDRFDDQFWRLSNLYMIRTKKGERIKFIPNTAQEALYHDLWYLNTILKARQIGFSTFIDLYILDTCLFNRDQKAGIIAHHMDDAKALYQEKIKFPYDNLDDQIKLAVTAHTDRAGEIKFSNGSEIRVSTSFRSGNLQMLHVSELGKIAVKYPEKAREIKTGAFEAVGQGQMIFVESTAEGREGEFYDQCQRSMKLRDAGKTLGPMDFKFHFFAWWQNEEYVSDPDQATITDELSEYFNELESRRIFLTPEQKAWYCKKEEILGDDMHREHPSYPQEAFDASVEGAYYAPQMAKMRREGRICIVPHEPSYPVETFWDLGMDDSMSIWFCQKIGTQNRLIDYEEGSGEGMAFYAGILISKKEYSYSQHNMPHDVNVRELGTGKSRKETARSLGISPIKTADRPRNTEELLDQIEGVRNFLASCWIDEKRCSKGISHLDNYRKDWDDKLGCYKRTPRHDSASHGADSLRTGSTNHRPGGPDETYEPEEEGVY